MAARCLVPQFLDPTYPLYSRYVGYPGMPLEAAATHYVGIAGVGVDAADYPGGDPSLAGKLGVVGYDRATSLEIIKQGRGLGNTILMIRVPFDGPAGVTPWMAGGGSTVRNIPDKNSLEPFLTTEANGERLTYTVMCDGSVRVIKFGVSDAVFKAMATVDGPLPTDWDDNSELVKLEPKPKADAKKDIFLEEGWGLHHSKDAMFTIALPPGSVGELNGKRSIKGLGERIAKGFLCQKDDAVYQAFAFDLPDEVKKQSPQGQLQALALAFKKELGMLNPQRERGVQVAKHAALEVDGNDKEVAGVFRVFIVGQRGYVLSATGPGLSATSPHAQLFFNSFKLETPKGKG